MRYAFMLGGALVVVIVAVVVYELAAGGGDDTVAPIPSVLASVCTQPEVTPAPDLVEITEPSPGDAVASPLRIVGSVNALGGTFFVSLVTADGQHVIDYPVHASKPDTLVPFEQEIPFSVFEQTPACVWVYRENADSSEAIRIPVVIEPQAQTTPEG